MIGLDKVKVKLSVEMGEKTYPLRDVLGFGRRAALDLDAPGKNEVTIRANGVAIARGRLAGDAAGPIRVEVIELLSRPAGSSPLAA